MMTLLFFSVFLRQKYKLDKEYRAKYRKLLSETKKHPNILYIDITYLVFSIMY